MNAPFIHDAGDQFPVLDLTARFSFKTASSIGFELIYFDQPRECTQIIGWIQVHHPGTRHIKANVFVVLPDRYFPGNQITELSERILAALGIPPDETYEILAFSPHESVLISQPVDRDGMTDRLFSSA